MSVAADEHAGSGGLPVGPTGKRTATSERQAVVVEKRTVLDTVESDREEREIAGKLDFLTDGGDDPSAVCVALYLDLGEDHRSNAAVLVAQKTLDGNLMPHDTTLGVGR